MSECCRRCWDERQEVRPAELILWGKLFPPEALGPRCYDCAAEQTSHHVAGEVYQPPERRQYAVYVLPRQPVPVSGSACSESEKES